MPAELRQGFTIFVRSKGARTVRRDLRGISGDSRSATSGVSALKAALLALTSGATIRTYSRLSDSFVQIRNRLGLVSEEGRGTAIVFRELLELSNRSRSVMEANAEVYTRLALSAKDLGLSQKDVLEITESLNQAIILSGATAQEARNGIIQLAQGFASNRLSGDELRAVLEQLPLVADVIAKKMGVVRGALRFLGERGKITADIIAEAFKEAREELAERFAKTVPTIAQSLNILKNEFMVFVGELSKGQNIISKGVMFMAQNFEYFGRFVLAGVVVAGLYAVRTALMALYALIKKNPIAVMDAAALFLITTLITFSDKIKLVTGQMSTLEDFAVVFMRNLKEAGQALLDLSDSMDGVAGNMRVDFFRAFKILAKVIDAIAGLFVGLWKSIEAIGGNITQFFKNLTHALKRFQIGYGQFNEGIRQLRAGNVQESKQYFEEALFQFGQIDDEAFRSGQNIGTAFTEGFNSVSFSRQAVTDFILEVEKEAAKRRMSGSSSGGNRTQADIIADALNLPPAGGSLAGAETLQDIAFKTVQERIERANKLIEENIGATSMELAAKQKVLKVEEELRRSSVVLSGAQRKQLQASIEEQQTLNATVEVINEMSQAQEEAALKIQQLNRLFDEGEVSIEEYRKTYNKLRLEELESATDVASGFERGWLRMQESMRDFASVAEDTLVNAFGAAEDALADFLMTGEFNFSAFVDSILADVARLLARQALMKLVEALGGGEGGGGGGGGYVGMVASLFSSGKQAGGQVAHGRPYVVGERGPELFVPPSHGRIIPNQYMGNMGQQSPVNVSVLNLTDPNEIPGALNTPEGEKAIINVVRRNRRSISESLGG